MKKRISISLVLLALIIVPLLKLQAAPTDLESNTELAPTMTEFLEDTKEVIDTMRFLEAFRVLIRNASCSNQYVVKKLAASAIRNGYYAYTDGIIKNRVGIFMDSNELRSFADEYANIIAAYELHPNPFEGEAKTILDQVQCESKGEDIEQVKSLFKGKAKIIDEYLKKYPKYVHFQMKEEL